MTLEVDNDEETPDEDRPENVRDDEPEAEAPVAGGLCRLDAPFATSERG
jgi:hypothetical protein